MEIIIGVISGLITFGVIELVRFGYFQNQFIVSSKQYLEIILFCLMVFIWFMLNYYFLRISQQKDTPIVNLEQTRNLDSLSRGRLVLVKLEQENIFQTIAKETKSGVSLSSDIELKNQLDISFITFGGPSPNFKTKDVIDNISNNLVKFDNTKFTSARTGKSVIKPDAGYDYGLILKIRPSQFPDRTWFTCAGIGEWGSSGAAWYLAKKWREINAFAANSPFALIVRVKQNQDQSAESVLQVKRPKDLARYEE